MVRSKRIIVGAEECAICIATMGLTTRCRAFIRGFVAGRSDGVERFCRVHADEIDEALIEAGEDPMGPKRHANPGLASVRRAPAGASPARFPAVKASGKTRR